MKRNTLNFVVDGVSAVVMAGMIATGLLVRFVLPPGSGSRRSVWGLGRHEWGDVHFWIAVAVGALLVVHVALHWHWVCVTVLRLCSARSERGAGAWGRNLGGVAFLVGLVAVFAGFVLAANRSVKEVAGGGEGHRAQAVADAEREESHSLRGSMTLSEAAQAHGVTVEVARRLLGLPDDVSPDERMGRLSKRFGWTMPDAREWLEAE